MGIEKLTSLAVKAFKSVKNMPPERGGVGLGLFAAGVLIGGLIHYSANITNEHSGNITKGQNANEQAATQHSNSNKGTSVFKYEAPTIGGKEGYIEADTTYYPGSKKISDIRYYTSYSKIPWRTHTASYDKEGNLKEFEISSSDSREYKNSTYNKNGELTMTYERHDYSGNKGFKETNYDSNERIKSEKYYDKNGVLDYTVVPKYDKYGDVIKNDTIRNNGK